MPRLAAQGTRTPQRRRLARPRPRGRRAPRTPALGSRKGVDPDAPAPHTRRRYPDIADHAIIGDRHTAALVGTDGSIDWFCAPHFDSPSVFARLLDRERGGHFSITPIGDVACRQSYLPDTNVLVTRFMAPEGMAELTDFMPLDHDPATPPMHRIVRRLRVLRGTFDFLVECSPAFDYGRRRHTSHRAQGGVRFEAPRLRLVLEGDRPLHLERGAARGRFQLEAGDSVTFTLRVETGVTKRGKTRRPSRQPSPDDVLQKTVDYWRNWIGKCTYQGRWREQVRRSALVLKLLTYEPTGAIVAAPTTSLPETVGGGRNWDYRYCWVRDSAYIVRALLHIGFVEEADHFMRWLLDRVQDGEKTLRPLYGVHGDTDPEETLDHLEGYRGSRPVRIGNEAADHLQLDLYGALFDALHVYEGDAHRVSHDHWQRLSGLLDWLCDNWERPDQGIWERRASTRHHTFSKLMCWVALDRGLRLAERRGLPADSQRWRGERDRIYEAIMRHGWNSERKAFVQVFGGDRLDASLALMPLVGFVAPSDPRVASTLRAIQEELASGPLVQRHLLDDEGRRFGGEEGAFTLCGFWLAQALARAGDVEAARRFFDGLAGFANHVGLFAEEIGPSGEALGNFPQGLTHLALIEAAVELDRALQAGARP